MRVLLEAIPKVKVIFFFMLLAFCAPIIGCKDKGEANTTRSALLIGDWKMTKSVLTNQKGIEEERPSFEMFLSFHPDKTSKTILPHNSGDTVIYSGTWKFIDEDTKVEMKVTSCNKKDHTVAETGTVQSFTIIALTEAKLVYEGQVEEMNATVQMFFRRKKNYTPFK